MIYKFIDNNDSEITVNSLSSLQALVDSQTVKEDTKVKAGLRGKWTIASNIEGLIFYQEDEEEPEDIVASEGDIKSFITADKNNEEVQPETKPEEVPTQPWPTKKNDKPEEETMEGVEVKNELKEESENEKDEEKSEYDLENDERDISYNKNVVGLTLPEAVEVCFKKYFNFKDRASRSEYWYFTLFALILYAIGFGLMFISYKLFWLLIVISIALIIPFIAVTARRLHDINKSGWFQLLSVPAGILEAAFHAQKSLEIFFMIIGWGCAIYLFILYIQEGDKKQNRFGENPLRIKHQKN
tara:strand:- start:37 stop:933 length:897 start_codon:yes stop_codon:yes gene_type:complete